MSERHPLEIELAWFSESEGRAGVEHHVRRCSRCRHVVANYGWLRGKIAAVLEARAGAVPVPQPSWETVREGVGRAERRSEDGRLLVAAGVGLMVCLMLGAPSLLGTSAEAQTMLAPAIVTAPAPAGTDGILTSTRRGATGTVTSKRIRSPEGAAMLLPFVPPPTPPASEG